MASVKLAVWNMEWLNKLFETADDDSAQFIPDDAKRDRDRKHTIGERKALISKGLHHIDADVLRKTDDQTPYYEISDHFPVVGTISL